ncbi:MAG TPA: ImpA family metalloprotease [Fluviicoccus sp.]|nr:ImpA family metalloprotease [Fluviicoccus sp.]
MKIRLLLSIGCGFASLLPGAASASDLTAALTSGNPALIDTAEELYTPILQQISAVQTNQSRAVNTVWGSGGISYAPGQNTQIFNILDPGKAWALVTGSQKMTNLAIAGRDSGNFVAWGAQVPDRLQAGAFGAPIATAFNNSLLYALKTTQANLGSPRNVTLAFMSASELANTRSWLSSRYPQWTITTCSDPALLDTCLTSAQLVLTGDNVPEAYALISAQKMLTKLRSGAALVYLHNRWSTNTYSDRLGQLLGYEMPYAGNWFNLDSASWTNGSAMLAGDSPLKQVSRTVAHLQNHDFPAFDWSQCTSSVGTTSCSNVPGLSSEFMLAAGYLRSTLRTLDQNGKPLFKQGGYKILKMLVLMGDKLRQQVHYPLDKQSSGEAFFKAYLADHLNLYSRNYNPAAPDTGTFSPPLSPAPATFTRDVTIPLSGVSQNFSTGLYALPGVPLTVSRVDTLNGNVGFYINPIRSGSTREWNNNGLARPKFLQSPVFPVSASAATVSSPYGGPIYLSIPSGSGQLRVRFTGVTAYPHLKNMTNTTAVADFKAELDSTPFAWSGIRTGFVDIASRTTMLRSTINAAPYNGNLQAAMNDIWRFMIKGTYELAGFSGTGLVLAAGVSNRCTALGWDCSDPVIHARPATQHITVDTMANCGSGCSGNPYDQDWPLSPIGWGESHEIGHNLQRSRLKIYSGKSTEVSNNIFPAHKGWQYYQATGIKADHCARGNDNKLYTWLQEARNSADPQTTMYNRLWAQTGIYDNASERLAFYLQLAYAANKSPQVYNGWQIYPLMYLHERLFTNAIADAARWSDNRVKLGFSTYASPPSAIDGNDFMLISYSFITGKDQRTLFKAWGISFSAAADQQVASYGFPAVTPVYYHAAEHCTTLNATALPIDGITTLP